MGSAAEEPDLQAVSGGGHDAGAPAEDARGADHDVLPEHDVGFGEAREQPVVDHRLGAGGDLLGRLEDGEERPPPGAAGTAEQRRRARQPGDVHVVTAGVHDRNGLALPIGRGDRARVRQAA